MSTNSKIKIVPLADVARYAVILAHWSYLEWYTQRDIPFAAVACDYQRRTSGSDVLPVSYVALYDDLPVGMASLKEHDLWTRKDLAPWLASLYVEPAFRNKGIGRLLVKTILEYAKSHEFNCVYLFLGQNEMAVLENFYQNMGWRFFADAVDNDGKKTKIFLYEY